jgi:hypothetical protein
VNEFDIAISPSQVETFDLCARKWAYNKIDRIPSPQNAAAALGEAAHKHREDWLIHGTPPPDDKTGKLARVGMEHLPPPGKAMVEIPLVLPVTLDADPTVNGGRPVRVKVNGRIDFFMPNTPDGFIFGEAGIPLIGDHKTTSGEQWAKTADDLLTKDSQAAIYAAYALHVVPTAPAVDLHWSYMVKGSSPRQHQVKTRISRDQALTRFSAVVSRAKDMLRVIQTPGIVASAVEPTVSACEAFGGCPYREVCPITTHERIGALMAQGSLNDLLSARVSAAPVLGTPAPTTDLLGLLGGKPAALTAPTTVVSNPAAMSALFGNTAAPAPPPPAAGGVAGLFGALGSTPPVQPAPTPTTGLVFGTPPPAAPTPPQIAPTPTTGLVFGTPPPAAPTPPQTAPTAPTGLVFGTPPPAAPVAPQTAPTPPTGLVFGTPTPAPQAAGVVPPDAPASDPALTLEDVKAMEAGTKKRAAPRAKAVVEAAAPASNDMLLVLTRIAVALEALVSKGS